MNLYGQPGAALEKQFQEMKRNLEALQSLQQHPGWRLVQDFLEGEIKNVTNDMAKTASQSGETALKAVVAYTLLSKIRDLPREYEKTLSASLAQQKK